MVRIHAGQPVLLRKMRHLAVHSGLIHRYSFAHSPTTRKGMPTSSFTFRGFLSYSHSTESRLAAELQHALQRFAKPYYALRGIHIFRGLGPLLEFALGPLQPVQFLPDEPFGPGLGTFPL